MGRICFEAIDCEYLHYVNASRSWVCMRCFCDLKHVDSCMSCRFLEKAKMEARIRKEGGSGAILRLASDSLI